jgi:STAM-binding protein
MNKTDASMGSKPMSAKQLTERAREFEWNPRIGFKYWARAAETIHHEGQVYLREGNFPQAYLVLFRYSILVLECLTKHPEAKEPEARKATRPLQKRIPQVIEILETLRPQLDDAYDRWVARKDAAKNKDPASLASASPYARHAANDPALSWNYGSPADILDAQDHQDLAVNLAREEMRRRRRAAGVLEEEEYRRRASKQRDGRHYESDRRAPPPYMDDEELRRQMEATRRQLDRSDDYQRYEDEGHTRPSTYSYPSINKSSPLEYERPASRDRPYGPRVLPPRPPKEREVDQSPARLPPRPDKDLDLKRNSPILPPPRPGKELLSPSTLPDYSPLPEEAPAVPPKSIAEPEKQKRVTFRPAAYLENGDPIRPVFLPSTLRQKFLALASNNTRQGLEMCGMLCGTTVNNALFISHLVIPEQKCTSDTCETENESGMLDYCITNDLIVIGWIHTHPTQTCFMSSRDLHTQAGYQVMMPESIAIVCAPQYEPSWGIFRLTNPPGLPHILSCQRTETFHHHGVDNLYVEAGHPQGHVYESKTLEFEVCDLRPGH